MSEFNDYPVYGAAGTGTLNNGRPAKMPTQAPRNAPPAAQESAERPDPPQTQPQQAPYRPKQAYGGPSKRFGGGGGGGVKRPPSDGYIEEKPKKSGEGTWLSGYIGQQGQVKWGLDQNYWWNFAVNVKQTEDGHFEAYVTLFEPSPKQNQGG